VACTCHQSRPPGRSGHVLAGGAPSGSLHGGGRAGRRQKPSMGKFTWSTTSPITHVFLAPALLQRTPVFLDRNKSDSIPSSRRSSPRKLRPREIPYCFHRAPTMFEVVAWKNGRHGPDACYGLEIRPADRDLFFRRNWRTVRLRLPDRLGEFNVRLSPSFWEQCVELRSNRIGRWMRSIGAAPWPRGRPPRFRLRPIAARAFSVRNIQVGQVE